MRHYQKTDSAVLTTSTLPNANRATFNCRRAPCPDLSESVSNDRQMGLPFMAGMQAGCANARRLYASARLAGVACAANWLPVSESVGYNQLGRLFQHPGKRRGDDALV
jgi:hypothetical protein